MKFALFNKWRRQASAVSPPAGAKLAGEALGYFGEQEDGPRPRAAVFGRQLLPERENLPAVVG